MYFIFNHFNYNNVFQINLDYIIIGTYKNHTYKRYDIHTPLKVGMSFIPTFGMILVVASSYQFWYEFHTLVFAV